MGLPENYNDGFYARHIADWGHLAYVAECVDDADDLAGYVLGRVNERGSELPAPVTASARTRPVDGHVTSLAVHAKGRRPRAHAPSSQKHGARGRLREVARALFECA